MTLIFMAGELKLNKTKMLSTSLVDQCIVLAVSYSVNIESIKFHFFSFG